MSFYRTYNIDVNGSSLENELGSNLDKIDCVFKKMGLLHIHYNKNLLISEIDDIEIIINAHDKSQSDSNISSKEYRIYKYVNDKSKNKSTTPKDIDFKTNLNITLDKDPVSFNQKGAPLTSLYRDTNGDEIVKRTFEILYFNSETIMSELGVDQATADLMADDLIWKRTEKFHWIKNDGSYSMDTKNLVKDYVPFVNGTPDIARFYIERKKERENGRSIILTLLEAEVMPSIMAGASVGLEEARVIGMALKKFHLIDFDSYVNVGDETIFNSIKNDITHVFLNYDSQIVGVDLRQLIINRLKQLIDMTAVI